MRELTDLEHEMLQSARWLDLSHHRGELLKELHARAQRLEATLVLVEDQRDKALKESETHWRHMQRVESDVRRLEQAMMNMEIARKDAIAERDALRKQLDDLKRDYTDTSYWGGEGMNASRVNPLCLVIRAILERMLKGER